MQSIIHYLQLPSSMHDNKKSLKYLQSYSFIPNGVESLVARMSLSSCITKLNDAKWIRFSTKISSSASCCLHYFYLHKSNIRNCRKCGWQSLNVIQLKKELLITSRTAVITYFSVNSVKLTDSFLIGLLDCNVASRVTVPGASVNARTNSSVLSYFRLPKDNSHLKQEIYKVS